MTSHSFNVSFYTLPINVLWLKEVARHLAVELRGLEKIIHNTWVVSMGQLFQSDVDVCWCPQQNWNPDFTLVCLLVSTLSSILLVHWQDHLLLGEHCQMQLWAADFTVMHQQTMHLNLDVKTISDHILYRVLVHCPASHTIVFHLRNETY